MRKSNADNSFKPCHSVLKHIPRSFCFHLELCCPTIYDTFNASDAAVTENICLHMV